MPAITPPPRQGGMSGFQPWVFTYEGVSMGDPRGDIYLDTVDGLSRPDARVETNERSQDHGSFVFAAFLKERILTFQGTIFGASAIDRQATRERMDRAFAPRADFSLLVVALDDGTYRRCYAKPTRFSFAGNRAMALSRIPFAAEFIAGDPRWYDDDLTIVEIAPQGPVTGFTFPLVFPLVFGGGPSGIASVTNAGTIDTLPIVKLYGPCTDPSFLNLTTGTELAFDIEIGDGDYLELDYAAETVLLNGEASRYSSLAGGSWDGFVPGENEVQFIASGTNPATKAVIAYRSAWGSI